MTDKSTLRNTLLKSKHDWVNVLFSQSNNLAHEVASQELPIKIQNKLKLKANTDLDSKDEVRKKQILKSYDEYISNQYQVAEFLALLHQNHSQLSPVMKNTLAQLEHQYSIYVKKLEPLIAETLYYRLQLHDALKDKGNSKEIDPNMNSIIADISKDTDAKINRIIVKITKECNNILKFYRRPNMPFDAISDVGARMNKFFKNTQTIFNLPRRQNIKEDVAQNKLEGRDLHDQTFKSIMRNNKSLNLKHYSTEGQNYRHRVSTGVKLTNGRSY